MNIFELSINDSPWGGYRHRLVRFEYVHLSLYKIFNGKYSLHYYLGLYTSICIDNELDIPASYKQRNIKKIESYKGSDGLFVATPFDDCLEIINVGPFSSLKIKVVF